MELEVKSMELALSQPLILEEFKIEEFKKKGYILDFAEEILLTETINNHKILKNIDKQIIFQSLEIIEYDCGNILVTEGEEWKNICIIIEGKLQVITKGKGIIGHLISKNWFGNFNSASARATILSEENTRLAIIDYDKLNENIKTQNINEDHNYIENINFYNKIGCGNFADVYLSKINNDKNIYACKFMRKSKIKTFSAENQISNEIKILIELNNNFIVKLIKKIEDDNNLCLLLEHVEGEDFFTYLCKRNTLNEEETQFYISNIIIALKYLHNKDIIYRDLKPENIVLSANGYLKLIDFGFSKKLKKNEFTFTICGTPDFMAPEIISGKGYNKSCDYWALGILTYEILNGVCPYNSNCSFYDLYNNIINSRISFRKNISYNFKNFISSLLFINSKKRLGNETIEDIKNHEIFENFNWKKIEKQEVKAPYYPKIRNIDYRYKKTYENICLTN